MESQLIAESPQKRRNSSLPSWSHNKSPEGGSLEPFFKNTEILGLLWKSETCQSDYKTHTDDPFRFSKAVCFHMDLPKNQNPMDFMKVAKKNSTALQSQKQEETQWSGRCGGGRWVWHPATILIGVESEQWYTMIISSMYISCKG